MDRACRVTSSVIFVSRLGTSVEFYRDLFSCKVAIHDRDAALLLAPGGFQIYLIARGTRTPHPSAGIGLQFLIWAVESAAELEELDLAFQERGGRTDRYTSGGVAFVASRDPDGVRLLVAHPSPETLPRSSARDSTAEVACGELGWPGVAAWLMGLRAESRAPVAKFRIRG